MQRIVSSSYQSRDDLLVDLEQIEKNSEQFNGKEHSITEAARKMLERAHYLLFETADPQIERLEHSIASRHGLLASPTRDLSLSAPIDVDSPAPSSLAPPSAADVDADADAAEGEGEGEDADADAELQEGEDEDTGTEWPASRASASGSYSGAPNEQVSSAFDYMNGARARAVFNCVYTTRLDCYICSCMRVRRKLRM